MQDIDNYIEDLLRRASYNYGLKNPDDDWEKIASRLDNSAIPIARKKTWNNKTSLILFAFLLITTSAIFYKYSKSNNDKPTTEINTTKSTDIKKSGLTDNISSKATAYINELSAHSNKIKINKEKKSSETAFLFKENKREDVPYKVSESNQYPIIENKQLPKHNLSIVSIRNKIANYDSLVSIADINTDLKQYSLNQGANKNLITLKTNTKLNFSLVGGIALSTVKHQQMEVPGYDLGLRIHYGINNRMGIETGAFYSRKNYYTNGKYFSMNRIADNMPSGMQVVDLKGKTTLIDIPVNVTYNLTPVTKNQVYVSAGINSFVVLNEKNNYLMQHDNNTKEFMTATYKSNAAYVAASANLSLRYYISSDKGNITIEPYTQIPIKGIGMGNLKISSSGLHIGYTFPNTNKHTLSQTKILDE